MTSNKLALLIAALFACQSPAQGLPGPAGPQGVPGPPGPQGPAGTDALLADGGTLPVTTMAEDPARLFSMSFDANCSVSASTVYCNASFCAAGQDCAMVSGADCSGTSCPAGITGTGDSYSSAFYATLGAGPLVITDVSYTGARLYAVRPGQTCRYGQERYLAQTGTVSVTGARAVVAQGETLCVAWGTYASPGVVVAGYR